MSLQVKVILIVLLARIPMILVVVLIKNYKKKENKL